MQVNRAINPRAVVSGEDYIICRRNGDVFTAIESAYSAARARSARLILEQWAYKNGNKVDYVILDRRKISWV